MSEGYSDTDAFLKAHYPNLDRSWLKELDESVGWLKRQLSGNALMRVIWRGGRPEKSEWSVQIDPKDKKRTR